jgi:hypothetical protein
MRRRGLIDRKGELFGYLEGAVLYTLEGEPTGRLENEFIVDMAGKPMWLLQGDAVLALDGSETIGYFGSPAPDDF